MSVNLFPNVLLQKIFFFLKSIFAIMMITDFIYIIFDFI